MATRKTKLIPPEILINKRPGDMPQIAHENNINYTTLMRNVRTERVPYNMYNAIINFYKGKPWLKAIYTPLTEN